jgi:hypothetical protein
MSSFAYLLLQLSMYNMLLLLLLLLMLLSAVIRKDLVLVEGAIGNCNTQVTPGQLLQQLQPVAKKGPRVVSLEVRHFSVHKVPLCRCVGLLICMVKSAGGGAGAITCCTAV